MIVSDRPVAAIAGGSRETGLRIVVALAASGWRVVLLRSPTGASDAERALVDLRRADPGAAAVALDVADEEQVDVVLRRIESEHGPVRLLVHGAGFPLHSNLADLDLADLDRLHRTLVRGAFVLCRWAARTLSPGAAVVLLSSTIVERAAPATSALVAGQCAVEAVARVAAVEVVHRGIGVHIVRVPPEDERLRSGLEHETDGAESIARAVLAIGNAVRARP